MNRSFRKRKREVLSPTDRISQLPRPILHHILSFLRTKDVVRTGILSKTWYQTSTSFPISDFCQSLVGQDQERIHIFVEFVRKSLQSQSRIYGTIPKFRLSMIQHSPIIEDCIQLATQNNVKHLEIRGGRRLMMPQTLLSAKELILLKLSGCHLPPTGGNVPTWPFLRKLCLEGCRVDGGILQNLTTFSCPLLECLLLTNCDKLPDISLSGLTKLTEVGITRKYNVDTRVIMVAPHVPSLKSFSLSDRGHCHVDLTTCKNLTCLNLRHFGPISSQDLTKLIAGLPALKKLRLCWGSDRIRFSSQKLEWLELSATEIMETDLTDLIAGLPSLKFLCLHCKCKLKRVKFSSQQLEHITLSVFELVEVRIDAPSLKTFFLLGTKKLLPSDLFMGRSSPQEVQIVCKSPLNLLGLRKILGGFKQIKLLRLTLLQDSKFLLPAGFMGIPLPDIKHLSVPRGFGYGDAERGQYMALLNELLWNCRPESISIHKEYSNVFCEELSKMVKGRRGLRSFKIKHAGGHGHADASFISCDEFLELLPTLPSEVEIHFMLDWQSFFCNFIIHTI